ncbi:hypothetical protein ACFWN1_21510 [Streptomyces sp. NPDC058459]|uniref:hypothetical protein n=1 Tax=Streptomyces sp. NPDC058459 TaxID=3346508 RepID=UPI003665D4EB
MNKASPAFAPFSAGPNLFAFSTYVSATTAGDRLNQLGRIIPLMLIGRGLGLIVNLRVAPPLRYRSAEHGPQVLGREDRDPVGRRGRDAPAGRPGADLWSPSPGIFGQVYAHEIAGTGEQHASLCHVREMRGRHDRRAAA